MDTATLIFEPGQTAGKYTLLRELGRGGMGVVYLARDTWLDRQVALKVLHGALSSDLDFNLRFKQEARSVAALYHPNIVRVHNFEIFGGRLAIDMEYVEGGSLAARAATRGVTPFQLTRIIHAVLEALAACHERQIVHRDVKPTNILLDARDRPLLTDFGLAKVLSAHLESAMRKASSSGFFMGTPKYAPPESWDGADAAPQWDLYSVGMVLYESLAGSVPYDAVTPLALMKQMLSKPIPPLLSVAEGVSPELGALVDDLVRHDPADRPPSALAVIERLRETPEFQQGADPDLPTVITKLPGRKRRTFSKMLDWADRPRWRALAAGLAVALVVGAFVLGYGGDLFTRFYMTPAEPALREMPSFPSQAIAARTTLLASKELLAQSKSGAPERQRIYHTYFIGPEEEHLYHWLMELDERGRGGHVSAVTPDSLWFMRMSIEGDLLNFHGNWVRAEAESGAIHSGAVTGAGRWIDIGSSLAASLRFEDEETGQVESLALQAISATEDRPPPELLFLNVSLPEVSFTDTRFIYELERAERLQPLIYNRLLPQPRFEWVRRIESLMPCVADARTRVPYSGQAHGELALDGLLTELFWRRPYWDEEYGRVGLLPGRPGPRPPELYVVYDSERLYVGLRAFKASDPAMGIEVALTRRFAEPTSHSPRWHVMYRQAGWIDSSYTAGGLERPWEYGWQIQTNTRVERAQSEWHAEIVIPFANLEPAGAPLPGERWRMNVTVHDLSNMAMPRPIMQWGFPDAKFTEHGALLEFMAAER